jgi:hypothetical protein
MTNTPQRGNWTGILIFGVRKIAAMDRQPFSMMHVFIRIFAPK